MRPLFVLLLAACGGKALDMGYDDARVDSFDPAQPVDFDAVRARCAAAGTDVPYTTDAAARAILAGRWFLCETSGDAGMIVPAAIEFTKDGAWYTLGAGADGVYARQQPGTYHTGKVLSCCFPDTWDVKLDDAAGFYVDFTSGPRQMLWASDTTHGGTARPTVARFVKG
jgi:hypothetical protein